MGKAALAIEISIHEVFADLDAVGLNAELQHLHISIHEVFADLDRLPRVLQSSERISIHEVFADLDPTFPRRYCPQCRFQSTRSSQTSTQGPLA